MLPEQNYQSVNIKYKCVRHISADIYWSGFDTLLGTRCCWFQGCWVFFVRLINA